MPRSRSRRARALAGLALATAAAVTVPMLAAPEPAAATGLAEAAQQALDALWARAYVRLDSSQALAFAGPDPEVTAVADQWTLARRNLADLVAERTSVSGDDLDHVWRYTTDQRLIATFTALTQVGVPYRRNAAAPGRALDCSGLTMVAWSAAGVALPHQSGGQINGAEGASLNTAQPGDLVWYPGHVMLYLGAGNAIVHAPYTGRTVEVKDASRISRIGSPVG